MLLESLKSKEGYEYTAKEFTELNKKLRKGQQVDFSKVRKVKIPK
jgi:hypothetical protein